MKTVFLNWRQDKAFSHQMTSDGAAPPGARRRAAGLAVSFGCFDGIHLGHQKALSLLRREAKKRHLKTALCVFHPHPRSVLRPQAGFQRLFPIEEIQTASPLKGLDFFLVMPFDRELASLPARRFVSSFINSWLRPALIVAGEDFSFGAMRRGNMALLRAMARGYEALAAPLLLAASGRPISTSHIKELLSKGLLEEAARLLGRPFEFSGEVLRGRRLGRRLGFPTANISFEGRFAPRKGVYAAWVSVKGRAFPAVVNIGFRPTFASAADKAAAGQGASAAAAPAAAAASAPAAEDAAAAAAAARKPHSRHPPSSFAPQHSAAKCRGTTKRQGAAGRQGAAEAQSKAAASRAPLAEAHILEEGDFELYGQSLTVRLFRFLREERAFSSNLALRRQIQTDIAEAEACLLAASLLAQRP